ncbi:hypothetical protein H6F74_26765 [Trichocoleus sp. FACHB-90]|uniref:hypothetical protein n=1 Tax=Cyanophyceae TaxID=3028117 RepID=UPI0016871307|nr:hypothetical protein [Trichocoleus sp. FACHB-90]MBD1929809.1 hypothetical protein [Trichocoleus sp. FACHB-90]
MAQVSSKICLLSGLAIAVVNLKQQIATSSQRNEDSKYSTEILAHHRAIEHVREVQANYQLRGWMR